MTRQAREAGEIAASILKIAIETKQVQAAWLAERGLSIDQVRELPRAVQERLQREYAQQWVKPSGSGN